MSPRRTGALVGNRPTEQFYTENNLNEQGLKCLQVLNEIICDFDQLLSLPCFWCIEKIKTIGSTYMAACSDVTRRTSDCNTVSLLPVRAQARGRAGKAAPALGRERQLVRPSVVVV